MSYAADSLLLRLKLLAAGLVATLPVHPLALDTAVVDRLAARTNLVLQSNTLGTLTGGAVDLHLHFALRQVASVHSHLPLMVEPLERCEVRPRVDVRQALPRDSLVRQLLGAELVHEVVLLLVAQDLEAILQILFDKLSRHITPLSELSIALFFGRKAKSLKSPKTSMAKKRTHISTHSFEEVVVREVEDLFDEVVHLDADDPGLLVIDETSRLVVESILGECCREVVLDLVDPCVVHVKNILLAISVCFHSKL